MLRSNKEFSTEGRFPAITEGARINFDLHAHSGSKKRIYEIGRGQTVVEGSITKPFAGDHSWFWRNRDKTDLQVTLHLRGAYREIVRPLESVGPCLVGWVNSRSAKNGRITQLLQSANIVLLICKVLISRCLTFPLLEWLTLRMNYKKRYG